MAAGIWRGEGGDGEAAQGAGEGTERSEIACRRQPEGRGEAEAKREAQTAGRGLVLGQGDPQGDSGGSERPLELIGEAEVIHDQTAGLVLELSTQGVARQTMRSIGRSPTERRQRGSEPDERLIR